MADISEQNMGKNFQVGLYRLSIIRNETSIEFECAKNVLSSYYESCLDLFDRNFAIFTHFEPRVTSSQDRKVKQETLKLFWYLVF